MVAKLYALSFAIIATSFLSTVAHADVVQIKCINSGANIRFTKVTINNNIYYTDQFGKVSMPLPTNHEEQNVTIYIGGNKFQAQISSPGEIKIPCEAPQVLELYLITLLTGPNSPINPTLQVRAVTARGNINLGQVSSGTSSLELPLAPLRSL